MNSILTFAFAPLREFKMPVVRFSLPFILAMHLICSPQLSGAVMTYASRSEWMAAVGDHVTEDFENLADLSTIPDEGGIFSSQHFNILVDANHGRVGPAGDGFFSLPTPGLSGTFFVGDVHSPEVSPPHFNTIQFVKPLTAFAANFAGLDDGGIRDIRIAGQTFEMLGSIGNGQFRSGFLGVVSTIPFSTVDIRNSHGVLERYGMDDVSFRSVAEPSFFVFAIANLISLVVWTAGRSEFI